VKISRTTIAIAGALPAGMLLEVIAQAATSVSADTVHTIGGIAAFSALVSGSASAAWFGPKAAIERHEETVRASRHRRAPSPLPRQRPRTAPPAATGETDAEDTAAAEHQARADALWDERAQRPPYVDPYLTAAAVDAARAPVPVDDDGYPAPATPAQAALEANLYGHAWTPAGT